MITEEREEIIYRLNCANCYLSELGSEIGFGTISDSLDDISALLDALDEMEKTKNWFKEMFEFATIEGNKKDDEINALERAIKKHKPEDGDAQ